MEGSTVKRLADAEAARAEAEQGDDEAEAAEAEDQPQPEPEPEPEPEPPAELAGGLQVEQGAELEKATAAYFKRVAKVFGADSMPPTCPHCEGLGFDLTGGEPAPEFAVIDKYKGCDTCDGLGQVQTGSKVPGHDLADCPECMGRGYLEKLAGPVAVPDQPQEYGTPAWMGNVTSPNGPT